MNIDLQVTAVVAAVAATLGGLLSFLFEHVPPLATWFADKPFDVKQKVIGGSVGLVAVVVVAVVHWQTYGDLTVATLVDFVLAVAAALGTSQDAHKLIKRP